MKAWIESGRIPIVESLRGWSATAVCWYHFVWGTVDYVQAPWARALTYWGQYGVTVFFVISSVVLPLSLWRRSYHLGHWGAFMKRRLYRLEPPYLVSILLVILVLLAKAYHHHEPYAVDVYSLVLHLGYAVPWAEGVTWLNPVYWSLAVEFQYYMVLSVLFVAWRKKEWRWVSWALLLGLSVVSMDKALLFRWLPLFVLGGSYVLWQTQTLHRWEWSLVAGISIGLMVFQLGWSHALVVGLTLGAIHYFSGYNPQWSAWLGRCSYSLYLVHLPIGQTLVNVLSHHFRAPWQQVLVLGIGYGASLCVAFALYHWVERPSQKWANKVPFMPFSSHK